jgi:hypothetical protein
MIRNLAIPSEYVHRRDLTHLSRLLGEIEQDPERTRQLQGSFVFTFPDYENEGVVFLAPAVRGFLVEAYDRIRHLWYYLAAQAEFGNLLAFLAIHASDEEMSIEGESLRVEPGPLLLLLLIDRLTDTARFAEQMADDPQGLIERIVSPLGTPSLRQLVVASVQSQLRSE